MPGKLKVGKTIKVPTERAKELHSTGVPTPFEVQYYSFFDDMDLAERQAHKILSKYHHGKEFFDVDVPTAIHAIESIKIPTGGCSTPFDYRVKIANGEKAAIKIDKCRTGSVGDTFKSDININYATLKDTVGAIVARVEAEPGQECIDSDGGLNFCFKDASLAFKGNNLFLVSFAHF